MTYKTYVRSLDGTTIDNYPFTWKELYKYYSEPFLGDFDAQVAIIPEIYPVTQLVAPPFDGSTQYVTQNLEPVLNGSTWELGWTVYNYSGDELHIRKLNGPKFREDLGNNTDFVNWQISVKNTGTDTENIHLDYLRLASIQNRWDLVQEHYDILKVNHNPSASAKADWNALVDDNGIHYYDDTNTFQKLVF